jgi:hypothetical protein
LEGTLITLSAILPSPFPKVAPPNKTCNAGKTRLSAAFKDEPWNPMDAMLCCPQAFMQPEILIFIALSWIKEGNSSVMTASNFEVIFV